MKKLQVLKKHNQSSCHQSIRNGCSFLPAGVQFYGVSHRPIIDLQDDNRPDESYIVIGALSSGDPILCQKGKEQISIYNSEAGVIESDEVYLDFFAFLNDLYDLLGMGERLKQKKL